MENFKKGDRVVGMANNLPYVAGMTHGTVVEDDDSCPYVRWDEDVYPDSSDTLWAEKTKLMMLEAQYYEIMWRKF